MRLGLREAVHARERALAVMNGGAAISLGLPRAATAASDSGAGRGGSKERGGEG